MDESDVHSQLNAWFLSDDMHLCMFVHKVTKKNWYSKANE